ncbi:MAG: hypothetical protein V1816_28280, partial [Pseudomonadota bacterium]
PRACPGFAPLLFIFIIFPFPGSHGLGGIRKQFHVKQLAGREKIGDKGKWLKRLSDPEGSDIITLFSQLKNLAF